MPRWLGLRSLRSLRPTQGVPGTAIGEILDTVGVRLSNPFGCLELHQPAQSVLGELAKQPSLCWGEGFGVCGVMGSSRHGARS